MTRSDEVPSETRIAEVVFANATNHIGTLFGGHGLRMMDMAAFIAASRHARTTVVTAATDPISFKSPIHQGELVEAIARVIKTGRTSLTVCTELWSENLETGQRRLCTSGNFVFVAIGEDGKPVPVPPLESAEA